MSKWFLFCAMISISLLLAGCGGGKSKQDSPTTAVPEQSPVSFSLELADIDVRRASNAEAIAVDIDGINSGVLLLHNAAPAAQ